MNKENIVYVKIKNEIFKCYKSEQMHKPIYYPVESKTNGYIDYNDVEKILTIEDLYQEIQELKKQLESANEQISYLRRSIERKEERIIDLQDERIPYTNEYVDKLLNQQKEFMNYLEDEIKRLKENDIYQSLQKMALATHEHTLQKYKEIIGVSDEESNNISS